MEISLFLFLAAIFLLTFLLGRLVEKIRVPWIFAALLLGFFLAIYNPVPQITSSQTFNFLAKLGMYFLLFIIGFELDLRELKKTGKFIIKSTLFIIPFEALFGSLVVHYIFGYPWFISVIVALSFATVGEAILVPILDEFKAVNTKLGQAIIGIGTLDDIFEILVLVIVTVMISAGEYATSNIILILASLLGLFILAFAFTLFKKEGKKFSFYSIEILFLFTLFVLFLFIGIGNFADAAPLAALIAGIAIKTWLPKKRLKTIENEVKALCYGFFAPIFFLWVGLSMDINYLVKFPLLILLIVAVSKGSKIIASIIAGKKELGLKPSILLGIGLSIRFSTSIIIVKILLDNGLIKEGLYSVIVASSIAFKFIVPVLFSNLLVRWYLKGKIKKKKN